jgi:hypothetical protein
MRLVVCTSHAALRNVVFVAGMSGGLVEKDGYAYAVADSWHTISEGYIGLNAVQRRQWGVACGDVIDVNLVREVPRASELTFTIEHLKSRVEMSYMSHDMVTALFRYDFAEQPFKHGQKLAFAYDDALFLAECTSTPGGLLGTETHLAFVARGSICFGN